MNARFEKYYKKRLPDCAGKEVWLVDGPALRREQNEDFVEYASHAEIRMIPKNEYWIEEETNQEEWKYFLEALAAEDKYLAEGLSPDEAFEKAAEDVQKDRYESPQIQSVLARRRSKSELLKKIRIEKLAEYSNGSVSVWAVDGELVRGIFMNEYASGGHDIVYPWIPEGEVWIDKVLDPTERKFTVLHELHERFLMHGGRDYEHAHHGATIVEDRFREEQGEDIDARIAEELEKNNF